ncbi:DUF4149 domain-containing protein [bacterium]|nr:DUF4149 domain-containing protein [bacterium]
MRTLWRLILGCLVGCLIGVFFIGTTSVFAHAEEIGSSMAGTIAGQMLGILDWVVLISAIVLIVLEILIRRGKPWPRAAKLIFAFLVVALILTIVEMALITPAIHNLRSELAAQFGSVSAAPDAERGRFGALHAISMLRGLGVLATAMAAFVIESLKSR